MDKAICLIQFNFGHPGEHIYIPKKDCSITTKNEGILGNVSILTCKRWIYEKNKEFFNQCTVL